MQQTTRKLLILITLVSLVILGTVPQALAANYKIEGDANGLTIEALPNGEALGNFTPGDTEESRLKLTNTNDEKVTVWIRTNITARHRGPNGGDLAKALHLLIKEGSRVITNDSFDGAAKDGFVRIGTLDPNEAVFLDFTVTLPGPETGNYYQGSSIDVKWTFRTESISRGGGGKGGGKQRDPRNPDISGEPDEPGDIIEDEPIPEGSADPSQSEQPAQPAQSGQPSGDTDSQDSGLITFEAEQVPGVAVKMPKTGEIPPIYFYGIGSLAVAMGLMVRKRKK